MKDRCRLRPLWVLILLAPFLFGFSFPTIGHHEKADVVALIAAVESEDYFAIEAALIEIASLGPQAKSAVKAVCRKLESDRHSLRGLAVDALVAIGKPAVEPLVESLSSPTPAVRAAALQALGRLGAVPVAEMELLANDPDPRVRGSLAIALASTDLTANPILIGLLDDNEPAVSIQAVLAIRKQHPDPRVAVPKLIRALNHNVISSDVIETLADYGTAARASIPSILAVKHVGETVETALEHIGPPDPNDIEQLCKLLIPEDHERTILVADTLARLGTDGKSAAKQLEKTIFGVVERALETRRLHSDEDEYDNSARILVAAEACLSAYWHVTHDSERFVELVEEVATESENSVTIAGDSPWSSFSISDAQHVEKLLASSDPAVLESAFYAISRIGPNAKMLATKVIPHLGRIQYDRWSRPEFALGAMGPEVAKLAVPPLVASFENGTTDLKVFAMTIDSLRSGTMDSQLILEDKLGQGDRWVVARCASALCRTSDDPSTAAKLVLEVVGQSKSSPRLAIGAFKNLSSTPEVVIQYFIKQLEHSDVWTRHDAVIALGLLGPKAINAADGIAVLLTSNHAETRIQAAKSLYLINSNADVFDQFLEKEFNDEKNRVWLLTKAVDAIASLGNDGEKFQHHIFNKRKMFESEAVEKLCVALKAIGSNESVSILREISVSKDWIAKSAAINALKTIDRKTK